VVPFFRDVMQTTRERLQSAPDSLARLHLRAAKSGCSRYSEKIKIYLTSEGQQSALRRLQDALDYQVWPIMEEGELRSTLKIAERSGNSSARRFLLLVDAVYPVPGILEKFPPVLPMINPGEQKVRSFKVKSRLLNGSTDIVAILGNGSFACTDPTFANYGLPCECIMAVFLNGNAYINVGLHYNREYVVPLVNTMDRTDLIQLGVTVDSATGIDLIPVAADAAFDYAVKVIEFAWSLVGHGGERFDPILHPPQAFKASKDTVAETLRKELQWIPPLLANNVKTRAEFYEFTNRWRGTLAEEGRNKAEAMTKATGGSTTAPTHKINWLYLSENPNAMNLLEKNQDKIEVWNFSENPSIFKKVINYEFYDKRMDLIKEELMMKIMHPSRLVRWIEMGGDADDF
jgi:hypothetical protein